MGRSFLLWLAGSVATVSTPPGTGHGNYPVFDFDNARPVVVVATVTPGHALPDLEECEQQNVICLRHPYWFSAKISKPVYGKNLPADMRVSTMSHYGLDSFEEDHSPRLMLLMVHGEDVVMPPYAEASLIVDGDGELYLVDPWAQTPGWLPCSVRRLNKEVDPAFLPGSLLIRREDYNWSVVTKHPKRFRVTNEGAYPRYGIPVGRLGEHLAKERPTAMEMFCPSAG
jgi:hypothetical protein